MGTRIFRRTPIARHGQQSSPSVWGQLLKFIGIGLSVVLVSGLAVGAYVYHDLTAPLSETQVTLDGSENAPPSIAGYEGGFNILLVGIDQCEPEYAHLFEGRCAQGGDESRLNDVNLLMHVSEEPRRVTAVSLPRDLRIEIPECTSEDGSRTSGALDKEDFNLAYGRGGLNCVAKTVTNLTGQSVDFAARVTFGGVIQMTEAIGGVEVCLASPIKDGHTQLDLGEGPQTLKGLQALQFLRTRHGLAGGSDIARIGNQQQYMSSLVRKMTSDGVLKDIPTLLRLASTAVRVLQVDDRLQNPTMLVELALALKDVSTDDIVFLQYPTLEDPDDKNKLVPNNAAAEEMWAAINANKPLEVTHVNNAYDGVVSADSQGAEAPQEGPATEPAPEDGVIALPEAVRGTTATAETCSQGVIYNGP